VQSLVTAITIQCYISLSLIACAILGNCYYNTMYILNTEAYCVPKQQAPKLDPIIRVHAREIYFENKSYLQFGIWK
jgi:hypothetical protein